MKTGICAQHRQARRGRVDVVLLVEPHQLLVHLLPVALVLLLDLLHLAARARCRVCIEWICRTVSGTSRIRTMIVSATIAHAQGRPIVPRGSQSRTCRSDVLERVSGFAARSARSVSCGPRTPRRRNSAGPRPSRPRRRLHGWQRSSRQPARTEPRTSPYSAQRVERVLRAGRVVLAGRRRRARRACSGTRSTRAMPERTSCRGRPSRAPRRRARCSHSKPRCSAASGRPGRATST